MNVVKCALYVVITCHDNAIKKSVKHIAESTLSQLKHRQVNHFGYEFEYGTNTVNSDRPISPIPQDYKFLQTLFDKHGHKYTYDQLTINKYLPGQGSTSMFVFLSIHKLTS